MGLVDPEHDLGISWIDHGAYARARRLPSIGEPSVNYSGLVNEEMSALRARFWAECRSSMRKAPSS
jgi:hypothetical protein